MKILVNLSLLLTTIFISAQENFTTADARGIVDTFFEGFHEGDTLKMRSVMIENLPAQTVFTGNDGQPHVRDGIGEDFLTAIANRPKDQQWEERLLDYGVQIDGNLAHVWTPYEFWLNGSLLHCGANAFTLAKTEDGWKIIHLIDSRRRNDCKTD